MIRLCSAILLAGCASAPVERAYVGHDCAGREITVRYREYISAAPAFDCAVLDPALALLLPLGCWVPSRQTMILPAIWTDAVREHELRHLRGETHPALLPMAWRCG